VLISNVKLKTELLFLFKFDAFRAFSDYLETRAEKNGVPRPKDDLVIDVDDEDLDELEAADRELEGSSASADLTVSPDAPPAPPAPATAGPDDDTPVTGTKLPDFGKEPEPVPGPGTPPSNGAGNGPI